MGIDPVTGLIGNACFFSLIIMLMGVTLAKMKEMPVFKPNDYFWKHHWDSNKEEKWEAYARVMQTIMARELGVEVTASSYKDKLEYRAIKKGKTNVKPKWKRLQANQAGDSDVKKQRHQMIC